MVAFEDVRNGRALRRLLERTLETRGLLALARQWIRSQEPVQILLAALCGSAIGILVAGLRRLIDFLHTATFLLPPGFALSAGIGIDPVRILIVPVAAGLLLGGTALVVRLYRSPEIVDPVEANALHGGRMSIVDSTRLVLSTLVSNASGASVGMEAGYAQLGSSLLSSIGQFFKLRRVDQRTFVTAGAAAAIAAAYNAPLAGAFYGFELIQGDYTIRALAPVASATLASVLTERALIHPDPIFAVGQIFHFKQSLYLLFALLGVASAGLSVLAMQAVTWAERALKRLPVPVWLRPATGGLILALIAVWVPQVLGSGHGAIQFHFDHEWALIPLVVLLIAKLVATAVSIGAGYRGGMFSCSLFLGCLFGAVFADAAAMIAPHLGAQRAALMMVGMGSVAAAVIGAPLTMMFLVLEGTGDFPMTAGVMVGVVISSAIVRMTFGYSFSTWRFHQRGLGIRSAHDVGWIADMTVQRLMRADPTLVPASTPVTKLRERYPLGSTKRLFAVEDDGRFVGMIDMNAIYDLQPEALPDADAHAFAGGPDRYLLPGDNVRTALTHFNDWQLEALPVLDSREDRHVVGYLTEAYALKRYNQELERRRGAELGDEDIMSVGEHGA